MGSGGGASRGAGSCAFAFTCLRRLWSRGRGPEEAGKLPLFGAVRPELRLSAVGRGDASSLRPLGSPGAFLPTASPILRSVVESIVVL